MLRLMNAFRPFHATLWSILQWKERTRQDAPLEWNCECSDVVLSCVVLLQSKELTIFFGVCSHKAHWVNENESLKAEYFHGHLIKCDSFRDSKSNRWPTFLLNGCWINSFSVQTILRLGMRMHSWALKISSIFFFFTFANARSQEGRFFGMWMQHEEKIMHWRLFPFNEWMNYSCRALRSCKGLLLWISCVFLLYYFFSYSSTER